MKQIELENENSYPVKMKLLEVGWMLNETSGKKYGLKFLQAVYNSGNIDLYFTDTIKITVEWLYQQYSKKILNTLLPIYLGTMTMFLATLFYFEYIEDENDWAKENLNKRD